MWKPSPSFSAALKLRTIAADAMGLSRAQLVEAYGRGFFVLHGGKRAVNTLSRTADGSLGARASEQTALMETLVFRIVKRDADNPNNFVSIGRLDGNDIPLPDETVSKFHAFVRDDGDSFLLQDARSRNGTTVDNTPVPARGAGDPVVLRSGQTVRFGSVATMFLDVDALVLFAHRFG